MRHHIWVKREGDVPTLYPVFDCSICGAGIIGCDLSDYGEAVGCSKLPPDVLIRDPKHGVLEDCDLNTVRAVLEA